MAQDLWTLNLLCQKYRDDRLWTAFQWANWRQPCQRLNFLISLRAHDYRYKYEYSEAKWTTNGVAAGKENSIPQCNPTSESQVYAMIASTKALTDATELYTEPISIRVRRPAVVGVGTEVLEIQGIKLNATIQAHINAYLYFPTANGDTSIGCPEFFATFNFIPHVGQASFNPDRLWRASLGPKLQALGKDYVSHIVVTLVQVGHSIQPLRFREARIVYDDNSQMWWMRSLIII